MRIHLKDPKYLYNKNIYEKIFREMKLESNSIKNLIFKQYIQLLYIINI